MKILSVVQNGFAGLSVPFKSCRGFEQCPVIVSHAYDTGHCSNLDLIYGHLRTDKDNSNDVPLLKPAFTPLNCDFVDLPNWYIKSGSVFGDYSLIAKVQSFKSGGYETTFTWLSVPELVRRLDAPRTAKGKRVLDVEKGQKHDDIVRSCQRAAKNTRLKIKSMGCDRLLTLTRRESNPSKFWRLPDWVAAWKKFTRLCARAGYPLQYVAVPELHKKGNYHVHAAIVGKVPVNTLRGIWWACCGGRGMGNIDVSFKKNLSDFKRRSGVARYVTKYITKQQSNIAFNKKRYWSSSHDLPKPRRYILDAQSVRDALMEFGLLFDLDLSALFEVFKYKDKDDKEKLRYKRVFMFPNGSGAWFNYCDELSGDCPF